MSKFPDSLNLYRGKEHKINEYISVKVPTLGEICDYGELKYYSMIHTLCSVGIDLCWQLEEIGIKFDEISDFQLFAELLCKGYGVEQTEIIFGNKLNLKKMIPCLAEDKKSIILVQKYLESVSLRKSPNISSNIIDYIPNGSTLAILDDNDDVYYRVNYNNMNGYIIKKCVDLSINGRIGTICDNGEYLINEGIYKNILLDEKIYYEMIQYLRDIHGLKRDDRIAGSNSCRMAFIEDAKMEHEARKNEPFKSTLLPMISTLVNSEGFKRNDKDIWDMNIYAFMDSVKRISKIRNATLLLQSGYSGFGIDLKKLKKDDIDIMGELN